MQSIGIDLGSRTSTVTILRGKKRQETLTREEVQTSRQAMRAFFARITRSRVIMEVCTESPWVSRLGKAAGHEVIVCNPHRLRMIAETSLKTDVLDSETLARLGRFAEVDDEVFHRVEHRSEEAQVKRGHVKVRSSLVAARTQLVNVARGLARSLGHPLPSCKVRLVGQRCRESEVSEQVQELVRPLLETAEELTRRIEEQERKLVELAAEHEAVARLMTVPGIGYLTALQFVLTIEDPSRFGKSRDVGPYLGLRPWVRSSADVSRRGHITKEGDAEMRRLLIQAAHNLVARGPDSALRRWGLDLMKRQGRKKAVVGVARKLAVLLHRIWVTQATYEPWPAGMPCAQPA